MVRKVYQFGCFALDRFELRAEGKPVPVEPQVLWLLLALVQCRGWLVTKQQSLGVLGRCG
jgi:DNA-binding winged helix-turn-helix (wHTH) protein